MTARRARVPPSPIAEILDKHQACGCASQSKQITKASCHIEFDVHDLVLIDPDVCLAIDKQVKHPDLLALIDPGPDRSLAWVAIEIKRTASKASHTRDQIKAAIDVLSERERFQSHRSVTLLLAFVLHQQGINPATFDALMSYRLKFRGTIVPIAPKRCGSILPATARRGAE